jgi:hypothetical protein
MSARTLIIALSVASALLLGGDLIVHRHGHFHFEEGFGFYPAVAFVSCLAVALGGWLLRKATQRKEDYYD